MDRQTKKTLIVVGAAVGVFIIGPRLLGFIGGLPIFSGLGESAWDLVVNQDGPVRDIATILLGVLLLLVAAGIGFFTYHAFRADFSSTPNEGFVENSLAFISMTMGFGLIVVTLIPAIAGIVVIGLGWNHLTH